MIFPEDGLFKNGETFYPFLSVGSQVLPVLVMRVMPDHAPLPFGGIPPSLRVAVPCFQGLLGTPPLYVFMHQQSFCPSFFAESRDMSPPNCDIVLSTAYPIQNNHFL